MAFIQYGQNLTKELGEKTSNQGLQPFTNWQLTTFKFEKQKYYLFVQLDSGLLVVTRKLEKQEFFEVLGEMAQTIFYISEEQRDKIFENNVIDGFNLAYNDLAIHPLTKKILSFIDNNPELLKENLQKNPVQAGYYENLTFMSHVLTTLDPDVNNQIIDQVQKQVHDIFPITTKRPNRTVKYIDLEMKFTDPRHWKKYENEVVNDKNVFDEIKENNIKIVEQYFQNHNLDPESAFYHLKTILLDYLNEELIQDKRVSFVTTDLGQAQISLWRTAQMLGMLATDENVRQKMLVQIFALFGDFYTFLNRVGLIRKADSSKVIGMCDELAELFLKDEAEDQLPSPEQLLQDVIDDPEKMKRIANDPATPKELSDAIEAILKFTNKYQADTKVEYHNKKRNSATYEIRAKLKDFKPSTWRRFLISGDSSIENLMQAIILMFNADFSHMYDLFDPKREMRFENQKVFDQMSEFGLENAVLSEKAKVSLFDQGDKLTLSYDYGDSWQFEVVIRNVDFTKKAPQYPTILSGKGLGIIENIGGTWGLQEYYQTSDGKEELSDFDMKDLNDVLKHPPYVPEFDD